MNLYGIDRFLLGSIPAIVVLVVWILRLVGVLPYPELVDEKQFIETCWPEMGVSILIIIVLGYFSIKNKVLEAKLFSSKYQNPILMLLADSENKTCEQLEKDLKLILEDNPGGGVFNGLTATQHLHYLLYMGLIRGAVVADSDRENQTVLFFISDKGREIAQKQRRLVFQGALMGIARKNYE